MLEKIFFKKVELWFLLLVLLLCIVSNILFGWVVKAAVSDDDKDYGIWEVALNVASIPSHLLKILKGKTQDDYISKQLISSSPINEYEAISILNADTSNEQADKPLKKYRSPIVWTSNRSSQPMSVLFRINEEGAERLIIFDERKKVVNQFNIKATENPGKFKALMGGSETELLDDGSFIIFPYGGDGLSRRSLCGETIWSANGIYHHQYSVVDGKLYILGLASDLISDKDRSLWNHSDIINVIDLDSGVVERSISIKDIAKVNITEIDPLFWENWRDIVNSNDVLKKDLIHLNKIEVLSKSMSEQYPNLPSGAWLLSARNLNLIMIVHPETLKILWYVHGKTQVQHDPKFVGDNKILVFNNGYNKNVENTKAMSHGSNSANYTSIKEYNLDTQQWSVKFNAESYDGYTFHSGNFDVSLQDNLLLNLALQGRFLEVNSDGELVSELINKRDATSVYWTKHAQYLSTSQFETVRKLTCN